MGVALRLNPWALRLLFVILSIASLGAFAALYVLLWWLVPQESLMVDARTQGGLPIFFVLVLLAAVLLGWIGHRLGYTRVLNGGDLYYPALLLVLSVVFFLRQIRIG